MRTVLLTMGFSLLVGCGGGSTTTPDSVYEEHDGIMFCIQNCCPNQIRTIPCPVADVIAVPMTPIRVTADEEKFNALMEKQLDAERAKISESH